MHTTRNSDLTQIRPTILAQTDENPVNSPGHFQNATLRPILNLQNDLLLQMFRHYLQKTKGSFFQLPAPKQVQFIGNSIRSDLRFRNLLIGIIIGHFTESEFEVFTENEQELTRRITNLLIERLGDQAGTLAEAVSE